MSFFDKINEWRADDTARGIAPWMLGMLVLILFLQKYTYLRTDLEETVEGLETRTMYVRQKRSDFCVGDMVRFTSVSRSSRYYRTVVAKGGAEFSLDDAGYRVDGTAAAMAVEWRAMAEVEMAERDTLTVPEEHVLFVNPEFNTENKSDFWAFEIVPRGQVSERVSHILFSRDFSRIGEPVGSASPDCIR